MEQRSLDWISFDYYRRSLLVGSLSWDQSSMIFFSSALVVVGILDLEFFGQPLHIKSLY